MASKAPQPIPSATPQVESIELTKKTAILFMKKMVEKGQDSGHYTLQDSHFIFEAVRLLEYDDQGDNRAPKPELEEKEAFEILINAITVSQKLGHCFTLEIASNAFRVAMFVTHNFLKPNPGDVTGASPQITEDEANAASSGSTHKSRLPFKKA